MSKKIMTKNTDKQAIDNLADNFNGYAALLRKIKQRVLVAQQQRFMPPTKKCSECIGISEVCCSKSRCRWLGQENTCNASAVDLKNDYSEIKGFSVRNMQCIIQFFNEYNSRKLRW